MASEGAYRRESLQDSPSGFCSPTRSYKSLQRFDRSCWTKQNTQVPRPGRVQQSARKWLVEIDQGPMKAANHPSKLQKVMSSSLLPLEIRYWAGRSKRNLTRITTLGPFGRNAVGQSSDEDQCSCGNKLVKAVAKPGVRGPCQCQTGSCHGPQCDSLKQKLMDVKHNYIYWPLPYSSAVKRATVIDESRVPEIGQFDLQLLRSGFGCFLGQRWH